MDNQKKKRFYKKNTKKDPNAIRTSSWFITVNSHQNKVGSSNLTETQLKQKLNQVGLMFKSEKFMRSVLYFATKEEGHNWDTKVVSFDTDYVLENGNSNRVGWHLHGLTTIKHRSNVRLQYNLIKRLLEKHFGKSGVYFHAKIVYGQKDNIKSVKEYMNKAQNPTGGLVVEE